MTDDNSTLWVLPEQYGPDTTADQLTAQITLDHSAMFPQTLTDTVPCDRWGQADAYSADPSSVTDDGLLTWINGQPEDAAIYVSHTWVYGGDCVVTTPPPTVTEIPVPPQAPAPQLAETGFDPAVGAYVALLLVLGGLSLLKWGKRS